MLGQGNLEAYFMNDEEKWNLGFISLSWSKEENSKKKKAAVGEGIQERGRSPWTLHSK